MLNFMGWTAPWMGGSGEYGTSSSITNNTQTNQDIATMLASCAYYGHHRRDISGSNANLSFGILDPFNEPDWNGLEGPLVGGAQMFAFRADSNLDIGARNEAATRAALKTLGIPVRANATAGNKGRTINVYVGEGAVTAKEAGGREQPLFGRAA